MIGSSSAGDTAGPPEVIPSSLTLWSRTLWRMSKAIRLMLVAPLYFCLQTHRSQKDQLWSQSGGLPPLASARFRMIRSIATTTTLLSAGCSNGIEEDVWNTQIDPISAQFTDLSTETGTTCGLVSSRTAWVVTREMSKFEPDKPMAIRARQQCPLFNCSLS